MTFTDVIEKILPPLTPEGIRAFVDAIGGVNGVTPLTLCTMFRDAEFEWLGRMKIDMRNILHTEQDYEFFSEVPLSTPVVMRSKVKNDREKAGMRFVTIMTEISTGDRIHLKTNSSFVVRPHT